MWNLIRTLHGVQKWQFNFGDGTRSAPMVARNMTANLKIAPV